jgi:hypothetical protein
VQRAPSRAGVTNNIATSLYIAPELRVHRSLSMAQSRTMVTNARIMRFRALHPFQRCLLTLHRIALYPPVELSPRTRECCPEIPRVVRHFRSCLRPSFYPFPACIVLDSSALNRSGCPFSGPNQCQFASPDLARFEDADRRAQICARREGAL